MKIPIIIDLKMLVIIIIRIKCSNKNVSNYHYSNKSQQYYDNAIYILW